MNAPVIPSASHRLTNEVIYSLITSRITPNSTVLDFGAGRGHMSQRLADYFSSHGRDPKTHLRACEIVPEVFQCQPVQCCKIQNDSVIPFENESFDLIYAIEVLEHTPRPYDFFTQSFAKLKPGGFLLFSVPNSLHLKSRFSFLLTGFPEMFGPPSSLEKNAGRICGHIMPLNYAYFACGLKKAGFSHIELFKDRSKRSALVLSVLLYPILRLASFFYDRKLKKYDPEVWAENREVARAMNQLLLLTSRSCIMSAQKLAKNI